MIGYENRRENLWKDAYRNDPAFEAGDTPIAKVISFFCKNTTGTPVRLSKRTSEVEVDYGILLEVKYIRERLEHTIRYTRKWTDYKIYLLGSLQEYVKQCENGGYSKCILSKAEYACIASKKKKNSIR